MIRQGLALLAVLVFGVQAQSMYGAAPSAAVAAPSLAVRNNYRPIPYKAARHRAAARYQTPARVSANGQSERTAQVSDAPSSWAASPMSASTTPIPAASIPVAPVAPATSAAAAAVCSSINPHVAFLRAATHGDAATLQAIFNTCSDAIGPAALDEARAAVDLLRVRTADRRRMVASAGARSTQAFWKMLAEINEMEGKLAAWAEVRRVLLAEGAARVRRGLDVAAEEDAYDEAEEGAHDDDVAAADRQWL